MLLYTIMDKKSIVVKAYYYRAINWMRDNEEKLVIFTAFLLVGGIGFGMGILWESSQAPQSKIVLDKSKSAFNNGVDESDFVERRTDNDSNALKNKVAISANVFVASKKGKYYHLPDCPGAKSIKPENKVEFKSVDDAQRAGYDPAQNCPGLSR